MKVTRIIMDMPITIKVIDVGVSKQDIEKVFAYFKYIDQTFSTFKKNSEISKINDNKLKIKNSSKDMQKIFKLAEQTKKETQGYFDIFHNNKYDPSGIVKGWAIFNAAKILKKMGYINYYVEAGGDIQSVGKYWRIGIKNPFNIKQIIKVLKIKNKGVATSGTYLRGNHIYNPKGEKKDDIVSLTVIGPDIYEADRFATAAFAMGKKGIEFINRLNEFEGYMIDGKGIATFTESFENFVNYENN